MGVGAATSAGATQHTCAGADCAVAAAAPIPVPVAEITSTGVGAVRLGKTYTSLRAAKVVGRLRPGCPLGGPRTRMASLLAPLKGSVTLSLGQTRRVTGIVITRGASAPGVGIGATTAAIRQAFPAATVDHRSDKMFGLTFVRVPRLGGGRFEFGVSTSTKKAMLIGIPRIPICD